MTDFIFILAGAFLYRWRGMSHPKKHLFPRPFNQALFALPYAALVFMHFSASMPALYLYLMTFTVFIITTAAVLTGHGNGMDLGHYEGEVEDERLEFIVKPLRGKLSPYWYDATLMAVTGLAVTLPAGILLQDPVIALSGALKAPAYMISYFGRTDTDGGEMLTGAVLWGVLL